MKLKKKEEGTASKIPVPVYIEFECPLCDQDLIADPTLECQEAYCPTCKQVIVIPKANISDEEMEAAIQAESTLVLKATNRGGLKLKS